MKSVARWMAVLLVAASAADAKPFAKVELTGQINVNAATAAQLDALPGIDTATASRIVAMRQQTPFKSVDEFASVRGVGKRKFERLKAHLAVSGPTTLTVRGVHARMTAQ